MASINGSSRNKIINGGDPRAVINGTDSRAIINGSDPNRIINGVRAGGIKFDLRAFIGGTSNQSYTDTEVLTTVAKGVIDGSLTVVKTGGGGSSIAAVDGKLELVGDGAAYQKTGAIGESIAKALGAAVFLTSGASASVNSRFGLDTSTIADPSPDAMYIWRKLTGDLFSFGESAILVEGISPTDDYEFVILMGGYDINGVPFKAGDTVGDFLYGFRILSRGGSFGSFTNLWASPTGSDATLYLQLLTHTAVVSATYANILVPEQPLSLSKMFQPRFLATFQGTNDDSIRDDYHPDVIAGVSNTGVTALESGADTWDIQSNQARNTPGVGGELVVYGSMSNPASWDEGIGWSIGSGVGTWTHGSGDGTLAQTGILTVGAITRLSYEVTANTSNGILKSSGMASPEITFPSTVATHTVYLRAATTDLNLRMTGGTGGAISLDDIGARIVTLNRAITSDDMGITELIIDVPLTIPTANDGFAGIITHLDDKDTPANYIEALYNRATGKVELNKYVAGSRTSLINVTATYSAGAQLRVIAYKDGSDLLVRLYYNKEFIGTEQRISDAGIVDNTRHGIMSVDTSNRIGMLSVMKRTDPKWDAEISKATGRIYF